MITLSEQHGYKVMTTPNKNNFWIENKFGDVQDMTKTKRTIKNRMKKLCKCINKEFKDF